MDILLHHDHSIHIYSVLFQISLAIELDHCVHSLNDINHSIFDHNFLSCTSVTNYTSNVTNKTTNNNQQKGESKEKQSRAEISSQMSTVQETQRHPRKSVSDINFI